MGRDCGRRRGRGDHGPNNHAPVVGRDSGVLGRGNGQGGKGEGRVKNHRGVYGLFFILADDSSIVDIMAGWSWAPVLLRLAKLAETGAAIKLLTGWTTPQQFGSAVLKVAAVRVSAIALENLVEWGTTGGPGITLPFIDQDWGLAGSDFLDTDDTVLAVAICAGLFVVFGLHRLALLMSSPQTTPSAPAGEAAAAVPAAAAAAPFPLNAPDQSGLYECIVDRLQLRPEASDAGVCCYEDVEMATPMDVLRQGEQVLICGAVMIPSTGKVHLRGKVYLRRLDGSGYYPGEDLRWKHGNFDIISTHLPRASSSLPPCPRRGVLYVGTSVLGC